MQHNAQADWRLGSYLRVYGQVRSWQKALSIRAFSCKAVKDFNEVTYHQLQVRGELFVLFVVISLDC